MPKFFGVEVPEVLVNYDKMLSKVRAYLPSLSTLHHAPQHIASYGQRLIQGNNPVIAQLQKYYDEVVVFANQNFGSSQAYFEDEIRKAFKKQPVKKNLVYVNTDLGEEYPLTGDFIARAFPCPEQKSERDQVAIDAISEFRTALQAPLESWKKELENIADCKIVSDDEGEKADLEASVSEKEEENDVDDEESSEQFVSDDDKKYCAATIQLITNLSTLHKYAVEFQKICAQYGNDPAMYRASLDTMYHFYEKIFKESELILKGLILDLEDVEALQELQKTLPNEKALLVNLPQGYYPSEIVEIKTKLRR